MNRYGDSNYEKNDLFKEIMEFLENHKPSELLTIVRDAIEANDE